MLVGPGLHLIVQKTANSRFCPIKVQHGVNAVSFRHCLAELPAFSLFCCHFIHPSPKPEDPFTRSWAQNSEKPTKLLNSRENTAKPCISAKSCCNAVWNRHFCTKIRIWSITVPHASLSSNQKKPGELVVDAETCW